MKKGKFNVLVDSAWGSSAKGAASARLIDIHNVEHASVCNFPNAGHTVIDNGCANGDPDVKFVAKVLPAAAILCKTRFHDLTCWIGPNAGIEQAQFLKELKEVGTNPSVFIHERAVLVTDEHKTAEADGGSKSTLHISSTMSGSGAAYTDKAMRLPTTTLLRDVGFSSPSVKVVGASAFCYAVREAIRNNKFLHEVSQGWALSLNHGTHYPYCTFRDCTPQQAYNDFAITPDLIGDVYLNVRSKPIRVGNNFDASGQQVGYSGDCLLDQQELTWDQVAKDAEMPADEAAKLSENERTTVTKKVRRVFSESWSLLEKSAMFCGATKLILNFPQYIHWSAYKVRGGRQAFLGLHTKVRAYVSKMEETTGLPVVMIGTGAHHDDYIYLD
jgi:adenylosuccinate synthase